MTQKHRVHESLEESLNRLGLDYLDLFLIHWPQTEIDGKFHFCKPTAGYGLGLSHDSGRALQPEEHPTFVDTWKEMEKLLGTGNAIKQTSHRTHRT